MEERFDWLVSDSDTLLFVVKNATEGEMEFVESKGLVFYRIELYELPSALELLRKGEDKL
jgi:hypothetical protein